MIAKLVIPADFTDDYYSDILYLDTDLTGEFRYSSVLPNCYNNMLNFDKIIYDNFCKRNNNHEVLSYEEVLKKVKQISYMRLVCYSILFILVLLLTIALGCTIIALTDKALFYIICAVITSGLIAMPIISILDCFIPSVIPINILKKDIVDKH